MQLQLHYIQKLHYTTTSTPPHNNYSFITPHYIQQFWARWPTRRPLQPLQPLQNKSNNLSIHQYVRSAISDSNNNNKLFYRFPILKLPPTRCAVLLVYSKPLHIEAEVFLGEPSNAVPAATFRSVPIFSKRLRPQRDFQIALHVRMYLFT